MSYSTMSQDRLLCRLHCPQFFSTWDRYAAALGPYSVTIDAIAEYLDYLISNAILTKTNYQNIKYQTSLFDFIYKDFIESDSNQEAILEAHEISKILLEILDGLYNEIRPTLHFLIGHPIQLNQIGLDYNGFVADIQIQRGDSLCMAG